MAPVTLTGKCLPTFWSAILPIFFEQLAIAAIDFGFLSDFEQPLGARIAAGVNAMADAGNQLIVGQALSDSLQRDGVEIGFLRFLGRASWNIFAQCSDEPRCTLPAPRMAAATAPWIASGAE